MIKILKQFPLFFAKKSKKAYNRNHGKDTLNIRIGITSFVYKISTQFFGCMAGVFGIGDFKRVISNFKAGKGVAMTTKFGQK